MNKNIKIIANHNPDTSVIYDSWTINREDSELPLENEKQRIDIQYNGLCFSFVINELENASPRMEVWTTDADGELQEIFSTFEIVTPNSLES